MKVMYFYTSQYRQRTKEPRTYKYYVTEKQGWNYSEPGEERELN